MNDRDYQKSLTYIKDANDAREFMLGMQVNPYTEAEARFSRIALEKRVDDSLA
jgi:hypothetical protein